MQSQTKNFILSILKQFTYLKYEATEAYNLHNRLKLIDISVGLRNVWCTKKSLHPSLPDSIGLLDQSSKIIRWDEIKVLFGLLDVLKLDKKKEMLGLISSDNWHDYLIDFYRNMERCVLLCCGWLKKDTYLFILV